jgi:hypothetical protein
MATAAVGSLLGRHFDLDRWWQVDLGRGAIGEAAVGRAMAMVVEKLCEAHLIRGRSQAVIRKKNQGCGNSFLRSRERGARTLKCAPAIPILGRSESERVKAGFTMADYEATQTNGRK